MLIFLILSSDSLLKQNHRKIIFGGRHSVSGHINIYAHINKHGGADFFTIMAVVNANVNLSLLFSRGSAVQREGRISYAEFVWFLISEEDKKNPTR